MAFTTLARNGLVRSSWTTNWHSVREWRRFFSEPPFCAGVTSLFSKVRGGGRENEHFRREVLRFFGNAAEAIVKNKESAAPRDDLRTPGGAWVGWGEGECTKNRPFHYTKRNFPRVGKDTKKKVRGAQRLRTKLHLGIKVLQGNLVNKYVFSHRNRFCITARKLNKHWSHRVLRDFG